MKYKLVDRIVSDTYAIIIGLTVLSWVISNCLVEPSDAMVRRVFNVELIIIVVLSVAYFLYRSEVLARFVLGFIISTVLFYCYHVMGENLYQGSWEEIQILIIGVVLGIITIKYTINNIFKFIK